MNSGRSGDWRLWRVWLLVGLINSLAAVGQGRAHARTLTALPVTHCNASSLQQVVTCVEGSVLLMDVNTSSTESRGTGFVIRNDATGTYVLTNKHVAEGGTPGNMTVTTPDGRVKYHVLAIAEDPGKTGTPADLAVVKLQPTTLRPLAWGDSERLQVGETVASIGYGLAFQLGGPPSVTEGIISALHRDLADGFGPAWIQHQSTINHGNSGGPLLDLTGDVVGVNTLSIDQLPSQSGSGQEPVQGVFFAIPANTAQQEAVALIGSLRHQTVGTTVASFYSTTLAQYNAWPGTNSAPPPVPVSRFAKGTQVVTFYFRYQGATAHSTTFQVIIRDHLGKAYFPSKVHNLVGESGGFMLSMNYGEPFSPGVYKVDLLIAGRVVANTPFTVGNPPGAVVITHLYSTTSAAYNAWGAKGNYAPPARTTRLPAGASLVGIYFVYSGAIPKVSTYQIVVRDHTGAAYFTGQVHKFVNVANDHMSELDNGGPFPNGTYKVQLVVNGTVAATTAFTVGAT
ncbi:MAG TPA: trypsin-like peptidase domain-containing protein [Chloroflexota bacterium]